MPRTVGMLVLSSALLTACTHTATPEQELGTLFENACVAPFHTDFGAADAYLRDQGFDVFRTPAHTAFEHASTGVTGAYSPDPEYPFCKVHDPAGDVTESEEVAQALLTEYFGEPPARLSAVGGVSAWGAPYGECCHVVVRIGERTPVDTIGGASLTLLLRER